MVAQTPTLGGTKMWPRNLGKFKLRGVNLVPTPEQAAASSTRSDQAGNWASLWSNWDWEHHIKPQLDLAAAIGANCVKLACSGVSEGSSLNKTYPSASVLRDRITQFCEYAAEHGMVVYVNLLANAQYLWGSLGTSYNSRIAAVLACAGYWERQANVAGIDIINEPNTAGWAPGSWGSTITNQARFTSDVATFIGDLRTVTTLPLTIGIATSSAAGVTSTLAQAAANAGIDFHDFHLYWTETATGVMGGANARPTAKVWDSLAAQGWFKGGVVMGEWGQKDGTWAAQSYRAGNASTLYDNRYVWTQAVGASGESAYSFGSMLFSAQDYEAVEFYGIADRNVQNTRVQATTPFAFWPGYLTA